MTWPQLDEYCAAIQNPYICFNEPYLKNLVTSKNKLGLPKVSSGNFACVYEVMNSNQHLAVRVFSREVTDQQYRYSQISGHLSAVLPPYMVSFQYITQGVMVAGKWYPIIVMDWIEGITITRWIWQNQYNQQELLRMAARWRAMIGALSGLDVAHSDLQHGNVLVAPSSDLKLVDYDCMFVPNMRGQQSPEVGHPNWNHPKRRADNFDSYLDRSLDSNALLNSGASTTLPFLFKSVKIYFPEKMQKYQ